MLHDAANRQLGLFGPIPFIRLMSLVALLSLCTLIALSTSTHIDGLQL